ncbi:WhiB family transcriptional regulator [Streptomyces longwoodensis]
MPCQTTDPEIFQDREHQQLAKSLCAGCDLKRACRRYARTHREGARGAARRTKSGPAPVICRAVRRRTTGSAGRCRRPADRTVAAPYCRSLSQATLEFRPPPSAARQPSHVPMCLRVLIA